MIFPLYPDDQANALIGLLAPLAFVRVIKDGFFETRADPEGGAKLFASFPRHCLRVEGTRANVRSGDCESGFHLQHLRFLQDKRQFLRRGQGVDLSSVLRMPLRNLVRQRHRCIGKQVRRNSACPFCRLFLESIRLRMTVFICRSFLGCDLYRKSPRLPEGFPHALAHWHRRAEPECRLTCRLH